jgi:hypothetical protein
MLPAIPLELAAELDLRLLAADLTLRAPPELLGKYSEGYQPHGVGGA